MHDGVVDVNDDHDGSGTLMMITIMTLMVTMFAIVMMKIYGPFCCCRW